MKILFVVPYAPTPIRTRPYNLLRALKRRGHVVTLATLWEKEPERVALKQFENEGIKVLAARLTKPRSAWNCLSALPTSLPLQATYCWQPALAQTLNSKLQTPNSNFDIVHIEHLRGARYGLQLPITNYQLPVIWDSVDCISYLFEQAAQNSRSVFSRLVTRFELQRTKKYEAWLVNQFDRVLVTSAVDAQALETLAAAKLQASSDKLPVTVSPHHPVTLSPRHPVTILPNGVALDYFTVGDGPREPETIVFSGKMSYHANVTAALHLVNDIMPLVWKERPGVRVQIIGQNPPHQVRQLPITNYQLPIQVTGYVPDLRSFLQRATIAVAPMAYGAGIQNKVLEAMACGTPVVATRQAVAALQAIDGEHLLVADDAAHFARRILELLADSEFRARIARAGRQYVERQHDWNCTAERLEQIYLKAIDRKAA